MKAEEVRVLLLNPAPSLIKYGIKWGFEQCGCYVHMMENVYLENNKIEAIKKISKAMIDHKINLLFCEGYSYMPIFEVSQLCKKYGIKFHWWAIEDPVTPIIGENVCRNKLVDFIWTTTIEFIDKYKKMGTNSDLLLFGCNPDFQRPVMGKDRFRHDISLIGTNYSNRFDKTKKFIFPLIENNFDFKIYGLWWMNPAQEVNLIKYKDKNIYWQEPGYDQLPYEWLPTVVNSSKIMIGINCSDLSKTQTSCRPYETLASAKDSVYLAYYTKAQEEIFGNYIIQVKSGEEMIEKAKEILTWTEEERIKFATRAREFVVKEHNYKIRAQKILKQLGV